MILLIAVNVLLSVVDIVASLPSRRPSRDEVTVNGDLQGGWDSLGLTGVLRGARDRHRGIILVIYSGMPEFLVIPFPTNLLSTARRCGV